MKQFSNRDYEDIIHLPHHVSKKHPQMSAIDRAAQFSPFAALTGHEDAIRETARLTNERVILDEDEKAMIDARLQDIKEQFTSYPEVSITFFKPDELKNGGSYETVCGRVKKIDEYERRIVLEDGTEILIDDLVEI